MVFSILPKRLTNRSSLQHYVNLPLVHDDGPEALAGVIALITQGQHKSKVLVPRERWTLVLEITEFPHYVKLLVVGKKRKFYMPHTKN